MINTIYVPDPRDARVVWRAYVMDGHNRHAYLNGFRLEMVEEDHFQTEHAIERGIIKVVAIERHITQYCGAQNGHRPEKEQYTAYCILPWGEKYVRRVSYIPNNSNNLSVYGSHTEVHGSKNFYGQNVPGEWPTSIDVPEPPEAVLTEINRQAAEVFP